ncbi:MAG: DUF4936 family protein [Rubrivivax sp.]|nr:DUF4936 family protein [Rubrivivax sp.]
MRELFVYWRTAEPEAALRAARDFQAALNGAHPGLQVALFRRDDEGAPTATLMETYAGAVLTPALEDRIAREGDERLARWLRGPRKVEAFVRLPG